MVNPNQDNRQMVGFDLNSLSFDSFERSAERDIVCLSPIRTVIRREEEILLIRRVRKVEEIDASPACPINTSQVSPAQGEDRIVYQDAKIE
ncbi:MAG: hypothetical protein JOZ78_25020 [Chroococcidiopsidaceae cyanobacterium CP_BM_ER_R8_30]|nr:hypothetical protein [Chroococcidiopsidaceae cyanobacterium CP_BM_ER_R8_30]